jgi:GDPmannose 4,6-dehydratase
MKIALILGVGGQTGSYLSEILLKKHYYVLGLIRKSSVNNTERLQHILTNKNLKLIYGDVTDQSSVRSVIDKYHPEEVYNLAAQTMVAESWNQPFSFVNSIVDGTLNCLESIREVDKTIKMFHAASSEIFAGTTESPQNEQTACCPTNPYGSAKLCAFNLVKNYREKYGMFACNGICYNHDSERRNEYFITKKISIAVAKIKAGKQNRIVLGDLTAQRDWSYAKDIAEAMHLMLQAKQPKDYILSSGKTHTVQELVQFAFQAAEIYDWEKYVEIDQSLVRPKESVIFCGDNTKAKTELKWKPKVKFEDLIKNMVEFEIEKEMEHACETI